MSGRQAPWYLPQVRSCWSRQLLYKAWGGLCPLLCAGRARVPGSVQLKFFDNRSWSGARHPLPRAQLHALPWALAGLVERGVAGPRCAGPPAAPGSQSPPGLLPLGLNGLISVESRTCWEPQRHVARKLRVGDR